MGDYKRSIAFFNTAKNRMEELRGRALISASDIAQKTGTILLNDKTLPYQGEFFEEALLHTYQALNYIFLGEPEKARVEIKQAELVQKEAEKTYRNEIAKSQKKHSTSSIDFANSRSA